MFITELEQTLVATTNPATVKQSTARLHSELYTSPEALPALVQILQTHPDINIRQLAGVEARKLVARVWQDEDGKPSIVSSNAKSQIKASLLTSTFTETQALPRHAASRVIGAIAQYEVDEGLWPELMPELLEKTRSPNPAEREVAVYVLYTMLDNEIEAFLNSPQELIKLLALTLADPESQAVRVSSVLALGKVSEMIDSTEVPKGSTDNPVEMFRAVIPGMVEVLRQVLFVNVDGKAANDIFEVFNTLLLVDSSLTSKHAGDLCKFFMDLAARTELDSDHRMACLQFLHIMVKFKRGKIQSLKLGPAIASTAVRIVATDEEDDMDDLDSDDQDEEDEDSLTEASCRLITVLATNLPPRQVAQPILQEAVPQCLADSNARVRRAGFLAMANFVPGASDYSATHLESMLAHVVQGLNDSSLAVRVASLQLLGNLAIHLRSLVAAEHAGLLPLLFNLMDAAPSVKVGRIACSTLDNILEAIDRDVMVTKYLDPLVPRLLDLLGRTSSVRLKSAIVSCVSSIAFSAGPAFKGHLQASVAAFESFVASVAEAAREQIQSQAQTKTYQDIPDDSVALCGITFDTLAAIASAVGVDLFRSYVEPLLQAALVCTKSPQNRIRECGFIYAGSMARLYEREFSPFLEVIMPEIITCLKQDELTSLIEAANEQLEDDDLDEDDNGPSMGINSALAMEKEYAAEALADIIAGTKQDFSPYLSEVTTTLAELTDHFYEGIQQSALSALWTAFTTFYELAGPVVWTPQFPAQYSFPEPVASIGTLVMKTTMSLLNTTDESSVANTALENVALALKLAGPALLESPAQLEDLTSELVCILNKQHACQTLEDDDEYDEAKDEQAEEALESSESDEVLTDNAIDVVVQLAFALGPEFSKLYPVLMPLLVKYAHSTNLSEVASGVGAVAEVINGLKHNITGYSQELYGLLEEALDHKDLEVRSNASYGVGLLFYYSSDESLAQKYVPVLYKLQRLLKKMDKKSQRQVYGGMVADEADSNERSISNACGCVARMAMRRPDRVPLAEVLPALLDRLPLQDGFEENTPVFELIVNLFQDKSDIISPYTERVVTIFSEVFAQHDQKVAELVGRVQTLDGQVLPLNDDLRAKALQLLWYLEQQHPGLVKGHANLAAILQ